MAKLNQAVRCVCAVLCLLVAGCEGLDEGDDPNRAASSITGDSELLVENRTDDDATVYFDGDYIGQVDDDSSRTWLIPSGLHEVTIDNADRDFTKGKRYTTNLSSASKWVISIDGWEAQ